MNLAIGFYSWGFLTTKNPSISLVQNNAAARQNCTVESRRPVVFFLRSDPIVCVKLILTRDHLV